ncbi:MAG: hypothetical protein R3321_15495, partial [Nitrososphaeraceae archaeon]|nr:hypothetical protein [Nitrososphaeraceae archaeon]
DSLDAAVKNIESSIESFLNEGTYYNLLFRLADLYCKNQQFKQADSIYNIIIQQKPNIILENLSFFRKVLIKQKSIVQYLQGSDLDKYSILRELNKGKYNYNTFPALIELSNALDENYANFKKQFENNISVTDYYSSYAVFKLSEYMLKNYDFDFARRLAGFALRFNDDYRIKELLKNNLEKTRWFFDHGNNYLKQINFSIVQ